MKLNKILGYILALIGVVILAIGVITPLRAMLTFIPSQITNGYLMVGGALIAVAGVFLTFSKTEQKSSEVPIYHGKNIVGFRRVGK